MARLFEAGIFSLITKGFFFPIFDSFLLLVDLFKALLKSPSEINRLILLLFVTTTQPSFFCSFPLKLLEMFYFDL